VPPDNDEQNQQTQGAAGKSKRRRSQNQAAAQEPEQEQDQEQDDPPSSATSVDSEDLFQYNDGPLPLVDELGVEDLQEIIFGGRGRIFSAAGRDSPVAEITSDFVVMHPPQRSLDDALETEEIVYHADAKGILLNEFGDQRKIIGARFRGAAIFTVAEMKPGTLKHFAAWFDDDGRAHKLYVQGEALTVDMIFRIRNRTHDGEISIFPEIGTD
jgi:hypothetical protein